jgi:hypothetical protein
LKYLPYTIALICIVLLFMIVAGAQDDWWRAGRKIIVVIAGFIALAIVFGIILSRTITS